MLTVPTRTKLSAVSIRRKMRGAKQTAAGRWCHVIQHTDGETDEVFISRIDEAWAYEMRLTRQDGRWVVAELRVLPYSPALESSALARARETPEPRPSVPKGGLTARHLRGIRFGDGPISSLQALDAICVNLARIYRQRERLQRKMEGLERRRDRVLSEEERLARRDLRLARVASCYVEARNGRSRRVNVDVARLLNMDITQVRDAIHLARKRGLISSSGRRGAPGGHLTARAIALLDDEANILRTDHAP